MKKTIAFTILLSFMFAFVLTSCQNNDGDPGETSSGNTEATETTGDNLPEISFDNTDFYILMRAEYEHEFHAESETGDVVNDAVFQRTRAVEERFDVNINSVPVTGNFSQRDVFIGVLRNSVAAGDTAYDMVAGAANYLMSLAGDGLFLDLLGSKYINFDQPWWSSDFAEKMSINGVLYTATGDVAFNTLEDMIVMFVNKQMCADYGIEPPYQLVKNGEWTFDKMAEIVKMVSEDVDGNDKFNEADKYGMMLEGNTVKTIMMSMGVNFSERDENDLPKMAYMSDKLIDIFDRVKAFVEDREHVFTHPVTGDSLEVFRSMQNIFGESRTLFMSLVLSTAQALRATEVDFGIIPMPKYDTAQENYRTVVLEKFTIIGIPASAKNPEMSEIIIEALASQSAVTTIPAYYDIFLKVKQSRDTESAEMLELIRESVVYDFAYVNGWTLSNLTNLFNDVMTSNGNLVSSYEKISSSVEQNLSDLIEAYKK